MSINQLLTDRIFPAMMEGNTILFLGAGASVTDRHKFFGSHVVELYSDKLGKDFGTKDFVQFADTIEKVTDFDRADLDDFVAQILLNLKTTEAHRLIASVNWRKIITTNYDLLLEKAYDEVRDTGLQALDLLPVRSRKEIPYTPANNQVQFYKLNGCLTDKRKYPLIMSTADFSRARKFYLDVLSGLKHSSPHVIMLSVGYSFADPFAQHLFEAMDSTNFREARHWIYNVDPCLTEPRIEFLRTKFIETIPLGMDDFFRQFSEWREQSAEAHVKAKGLGFVRKDRSKASITPYLQAKIGDDLVQLTEYSASRAIDARDFYLGEEPTYDVIRKSYDVVKQQTLSDLRREVKNLLEAPQPIFPIMFLRGSFGTGKSTTEYRLLYDLWRDESINCAIFRVGDAKRLSTAMLIEVFECVNADSIILHFEQVEVDSSFKEMMQLRNLMSQTDFHRQVLFIASVRENIIAKYLEGKDYPNLKFLNVDSPLDEGEVLDLLLKLDDAHLLERMDARTRAAKVREIIGAYGGDSFVTLLGILTNGKHERDIFDAIDKLPQLAQKAFQYTALLHQHGLLIPAGVLRRIVSVDWDKFLNEVIRIECRGILIQEDETHRDANGDLQFRTKHPLIAQRYISRSLPNEDKLFEGYRDILSRLEPTPSDALLATNLLRSLHFRGELGEQKISKLYDTVANKLEDDPHFVLHYAINLQYRATPESLTKALEKLIYGEGLRERRNLRMIHRRAVINFRLGQMSFEEDGSEISDQTFRLLSEAKQLFDVKRTWEPDSSYSYVDYIRFELWCLKHLSYDKTEILEAQVAIQQLLDQAHTLVHENRNRIAELNVEFNTLISSLPNAETIEELLDDDEARPFALLRLFRGAQTEGAISKIVNELQEFRHISAVSEALMHYYGERLYVPDNRTNLFKILREDVNLKERLPVYAFFYSYVADAYNQHWASAFDQLDELRRMDIRVPRDLVQVWRDASGAPIDFDAIGIAKNRGRRMVRLIDMQRECELLRGCKPVQRNEKASVQVLLFSFGIRAKPSKADVE